MCGPVQMWYTNKVCHPRRSVKFCSNVSLYVRELCKHISPEVCLNILLHHNVVPASVHSIRCDCACHTCTSKNDLRPDYTELTSTNWRSIYAIKKENAFSKRS